MDYRMVRTDRYKYIHWMQHPGLDELYDLETDPFETVNLANDPDAQGIRADMRVRLGRLVLEAMGIAAGGG